MNVRKIREAKSWFQVLQTGKKAQTAIMTLRPGQKSGDEPEAHKGVEQVLFMVKGRLVARVGEKRASLKAGESLLIPAGVKHQIENRGKTKAVTFNVYAPPEYDPDEKG